MLYNFVDVVDVRPCLSNLMFLLANFKTRKFQVVANELIACTKLYAFMMIKCSQSFLIFCRFCTSSVP
jgi:hypothetical protein